MQTPIVSGIFADTSPDLRTSYPVNQLVVPMSSGASAARDLRLSLAATGLAAAGLLAVAFSAVLTPAEGASTTSTAPHRAAATSAPATTLRLLCDRADEGRAST